MSSNICHPPLLLFVCTGGLTPGDVFHLTRQRVPRAGAANNQLVYLKKEIYMDFVWVQTCTVHDCHSQGATENAGMENAGLENMGPNRMGGNRRTGKRRTKIPVVFINSVCDDYTTL